MSIRFFTVAAVVVPCVLAAQSGDLFDSVRNGDLTALRAGLSKPGAADSRNSKGVPLVMQAAAFGSVQALRIVIEAGADVNAKNSFDATALMWAAGDAAKAHLLIAHGADVNARSKQGRTPLTIAAAHHGASGIVRELLDKGADLRAKDGFLETTALLSAAQYDDTETVRLLVEKGADVNAANKGGDTPLMDAASTNDLAVVKLLLAKGADVNAANVFAGKVKFGPIALMHITPLMWAAPGGSPQLIKALLDAGAKVNVKDSRGMTALMLAVASETQDVEVARLLVAAGADVNVKSEAGETALDWALKFGNKDVIAALRKAGATTAAVYAPPERKRADASPAADRSVEKAVALLQRTSTEFFKQSGCVGCHHQPVTAMAVESARAAGFRVDEAAAREQVEMMKAGLVTMQELFLQRIDGPGNPDIATYSLLGMSAGGYKPDVVTDCTAINIAAQQRADGSWFLGGVSRAPMEESNISRTALAARVLKLYGPPGRKAEFEARIGRARSWLLEARPKTTDELAMRLRGLVWTGAGKGEIDRAAHALAAIQRADGGWASNPNLASDAFATGESLYALRESGAMTVSDGAYRRGVGFLLSTQFEDGSWYVRSRAPKFQPYFQSGFPYDHDQWISATATAWAVAALAPAGNGSVASK